MSWKTDARSFFEGKQETETNQYACRWWQCQNAKSETQSRWRRERISRSRKEHETFGMCRRKTTWIIQSIPSTFSLKECHFKIFWQKWKNQCSPCLSTEYRGWSRRRRFLRHALKREQTHWNTVVPLITRHRRTFPYGCRRYSHVAGKKGRGIRGLVYQWSLAGAILPRSGNFQRQQRWCFRLGERWSFTCRRFLSTVSWSRPK